MTIENFFESRVVKSHKYLFKILLFFKKFKQSYFLKIIFYYISWLKTLIEEQTFKNSM